MRLAAFHAQQRCCLADLVEEADSVSELSIAQVGLQEPEEGQQEALEAGPPLVVGRQQQFWHQAAVTHQLQPGKCKPWHPQWLHSNKSDFSSCGSLKRRSPADFKNAALLEAQQRSGGLQQGVCRSAAGNSLGGQAATESRKASSRAHEMMTQKKIIHGEGPNQTTCPGDS